MSTEIRTDKGIINIWEARPGEWKWTTPDGSFGDASSFEDAETDAKEALGIE